LDEFDFDFDETEADLNIKEETAVYLGVDWNPEQEPRGRWDEDVRMMREMGVNVVRLAESGWGLIEPEEGKYDFSLFDEAVELLHKHGIDVILGTPTAAPPAWLCKKHPEILLTDENGTRVSFGGWRTYSVNSDAYWKYSRKIIEAMARHYADHPAVIGWQTDNGYGHENSDLCYSVASRNKFRQWLKRKYGSLEALNKAWGTVFRSQIYTSWDQIPVPRKTIGRHNPGLLLDFRRFTAERWTLYNRMQVETLRSIVPDYHFIMHHFVFLDQAIDQKKMSEDLDVVACGLPVPVSPAAAAHVLDLSRGMKGGRGFWVMEQPVGALDWDRISCQPRPGQIKLWMFQAVAHGAEAIVCFRWRTSRFGTEESCRGILDHDGVPKRKYWEMKEVFDQLRLFGDDWIRSRIDARVAALYDVENAWALKIQPQSSAFDYKNEWIRFYTPAHEWNVPVDLIGPEDGLDKYRVVIAPVWFLVNPSFAARLEAFAENGGTVVLTYRSGVKEPDNRVTELTLPGMLARMAGIRIHEYEGLCPGQAYRVKGVAGKIRGADSPAEIWCDLIEQHGAEKLAEYREAFFEGTPAITRHEFGKGTVYYVGTAVSVELLLWLYKEIFDRAGVETFASPAGVEVYPRILPDGKRILAVLNHTAEKQSVYLPEGCWMDLATGEKKKERIDLNPLESMVIREE
jgi:beta-galactosidase